MLDPKFSVSLVSFAAVYRDVTQRSPERFLFVAWHPERRLRRRLVFPLQSVNQNWSGLIRANKISWFTCTIQLDLTIILGPPCQQSLYSLCASRCFETVSNPGLISIALRTPYWFAYWRLDLTLVVSKIWCVRWINRFDRSDLPRNLDRGDLKDLTRFCRVFLTRPLVTFSEALRAGCIGTAWIENFSLALNCVISS